MKKITNIYFDIKNILGKNFANKLIFLIIILFFTSLVEMATLSLFPIYVGLLLDQEKYQTIMGYELADINQFMPLGSTIHNFGLLLVCCLFLKIIFILFSYFYELNSIRKIKVKLSEELYKNYISRPYLFFVNTNSSIIYRSIVQQVQEAMSYVQSMATLIREFFILLIISILLILYNPEIALSSIITFVVLGSIFYISTTLILKKNAARRIEASERKISIVSEMFSGIKEIKVFVKENFFIARFLKANIVFEKSQFIQELIRRMPKLFFEFLAVSLLVLITFLFLYQGNTSSEIFPLLGLLAICVVRLIPVFSSINASFTYLRSHKISYDNIVDEFNNFVSDKLIQSNIEKNYETNKNSDILVELKDIHYKFNNNQKPVLKNISLSVQKNEFIGIVGKSGSGKTTLVNIILGLLKAESGKIYKKKDVIISYVPQDIFILDNSLKENIAFGVEKEMIDDSKINECIEKSQLGELVKNKHLGSETITGEKGSKFSGGERQRVGIARSLYKNASILIFDEATNALDTQTENEIIKTLISLKDKLSIIIISHHHSTLKFCDKIYYLDNGNIKDEGKLSDLLNKYPLLQENNEQN